MLRGVQFTNSNLRLNLLYGLRDPWDMDSSRERARFASTNAFVLGELGHLGRLLEVGCGEGHQTAAFAEIAREVTGVDVSSVAVARARVAHPGFEFIVGDVATAAGRFPAGHFNLVTACEVLYYMSDPAEALRRMETLGDAVLVTYVDRYHAALDPLVIDRPGVTVQRISFQDVGWTAALLRRGVSSAGTT
jgi:SAM-dependent methyltransferase